MKNQPYTDEVLMAYADGELDVATARGVEAAMAEDERLAERVALFADTRRSTKDALAPMLKEPVPARLEASVRDMLARSAAGTADADSNVVAFRPSAKPSFAERLLNELPLAASIAIIAGAIGYYLGQPGGAPSTNLTVASVDQPAIVQALGTVRSGETANLDGNGRFRAIASYRDNAGSLCREFEFDKNREAAVVAVACNANGSWDVRFAVATSQSAEGYAPASSLEALDAFLQATGAGQPLPPDEEDAALKGLSPDVGLAPVQSKPG